jgi:hypothetical protein
MVLRSREVIGKFILAKGGICDAGSFGAFSFDLPALSVA